ncbi:baseplate J/gp47 family protein [Bacillus sp. CGMCC 1.16541]|uniref:baseplate J/gp47 family protein n=1 Tax=Bacillus sp. CGMCC 1.16541 TaxID=2185143 RepID=UPI000D7387D5|nr:baseplate J/gp47 family protein [Bacillus sp. CGMCC 1.16541]
MSYPAWFNETVDDLINQMLDDVDPAYDKREGGFVYDVLWPIANQRSLSREELKNAIDMAFVANSEGDQLDQAIADRSPLRRYLEEYAYGYVTVYGNPGTPLNQGTRFMSINYSDSPSIEFELRSDVTIGDSGEIDVLVHALEPGEIGNIPPGTIEIASPLVGVSAVTNKNHFDGGRDRESDTDFKNRYFKWRSEKGSSGNRADYVRWALEVTGVGGVAVFPTWNGRNTVKVVLVDSDFSPADDIIIQAARDYIDPTYGQGDGKAPVGAIVTIESATPIPIRISVKASADDLNSVKSQIKESLKGYLKEVNNKYWAQTKIPTDYKISYLKLGSLMVDAAGVDQVTDLRVNNSTDDIVIPAGSVAQLEEVVFDE